VTTYVAQVCQELSRGELLEVETRYNIAVTEAQYLRIVRDKTASLFAACGHLGAFLAGARTQTIGRITEFGLNIGMAFQIMDDCLDLIGEERTVGKTVRSDLEKGSLSLPVIYLVSSLSRERREILFKPLRQRRVTATLLSKIAREARETGAIEKARRRAQGYLGKATEAVAVRDGVVLRETYRQLARYMMERAS